MKGNAPTTVDFGIGRFAQHSKESYDKICSLTEQVLIPQAELMEHEGLLLASKILNEITCSLPQPLAVRETPPGELPKLESRQHDSLVLERDRIQNLVNQLSTVETPVVGSSPDFGFVDGSPLNLTRMQNLCRIVNNELKPEVNVAKRAVRVVVDGKDVNAQFLDEALDCATSAIEKYTCQAEQVPSVQDEVVCLNRFALKL